MFSKQAKSEPRISSIIGAGTEIEGDIKTNESVRVDGKIKGNVQADAVFVGEHGIIMGNVNAKSVNIGGRVQGNISASTFLQLLATGYVTGDIQSHNLVIADGARFEGNCHMAKTEGQIIELPADMLNKQNNQNQNGKNSKVANDNKH